MKAVEDLIISLNKSNSQAYKQLCGLMNRYKRKHMSPLETFKEVMVLFPGKYSPPSSLLPVRPGR
jgi:hypothetical protein